MSDSPLSAEQIARLPLGAIAELQRLLRKDCVRRLAGLPDWNHSADLMDADGDTAPVVAVHGSLIFGASIVGKSNGALVSAEGNLVNPVKDFVDLGGLVDILRYAESSGVSTEQNLAR